MKVTVELDMEVMRDRMVLRIIRDWKSIQQEIEEDFKFYGSDIEECPGWSKGPKGREDFANMKARHFALVLERYFKEPPSE